MRSTFAALALATVLALPALPVQPALATPAIQPGTRAFDELHDLHRRVTNAIFDIRMHARELRRFAEIPIVDGIPISNHAEARSLVYVRDAADMNRKIAEGMTVLRELERPYKRALERASPRALIEMRMGAGVKAHADDVIKAAFDVARRSRGSHAGLDRLARAADEIRTLAETRAYVHGDGLHVWTPKIPRGLEIKRSVFDVVPRTMPRQSLAIPLKSKRYGRPLAAAIARLSRALDRALTSKNRITLSAALVAGGSAMIHRSMSQAGETRPGTALASISSRSIRLLKPSESVSLQLEGALSAAERASAGHAR